MILEKENGTESMINSVPFLLIFYSATSSETAIVFAGPSPT